MYCVHSGNFPHSPKAQSQKMACVEQQVTDFFTKMYLNFFNFLKRLIAPNM